MAHAFSALYIMIPFARCPAVKEAFLSTILEVLSHGDQEGSPLVCLPPPPSDDCWFFLLILTFLVLRLHLCIITIGLVISRYLKQKGLL